MTDVAVRITAVAAEIPPHVVTAAEVEERAGIAARFRLEPGWLERTTGVRRTRWAPPDMPASELAVRAARKAVAGAGLPPADVDALVYAGMTRDCVAPATATVVADALGAHRARVFDLTNASNGVVDALDVADALIRCGKAERVVITTGERGSLAALDRAPTLDALRRAAGVLVAGDAGGALVVEPSDDRTRGLRARDFRSAPVHWRNAVVGRMRAGSAACELCGSVVDRHAACDGPAVLEAVLGLLQPAATQVLAATGWDVDDLDVVFSHQPTKRAVEHALARLGPLADAAPKLWSTAERFGDTTSCSIPLAMAEAAEAGILVPGAKVLVLAPSFGASAAALTLVW